MKKLLSIVLALVMTLGLCAIPAWANDPVTYLKEDGTTGTCTGYATVTNSTTTWSGTGAEATWYVVEESGVTISGKVTVNGDVHLILCNGATLTVENGITGEGSLTIYGQPAETGKKPGKLVATGTEASGYYGIGITSLTINGGEVAATGGETENGESYGVSADDLMVNGGKLTGTGSKAGMSCGICCPYNYTANGSMTINGGEVTGTGGESTGMLSVGVEALSLVVNGGKLTGTGGKGVFASIGIFAADFMYVNKPTGGATAASTAHPVIIGTGGEVMEDGIMSIGIIGYQDIFVDSGANAVGTTSAELEATGGTMKNENGISCGILTMSMLVGVSNASTQNASDEPETASTTGSTVKLTAKGGDVGVLAVTTSSNKPAVWLNGGTLTAVGSESGIANSSGYSLDMFGIEAYDSGSSGSATTTVYVQKGTLIAEAGSTGSGLALGEKVSDEVPLKCPAEYWWRISKTGDYTRYPDVTAYTYNGTDSYVEITTDSDRLTVPEEMPDDEVSGGHTPIRRQHVTAVEDTTDTTTDTTKTEVVTSAKTFDAGVALYGVMAVLSLTGSAWVMGKKR